MFGALGQEGVQWLTKFINRLLSEEAIQEDLKRGTMVPIYKGKENVLDCGNFRGIKQLEHGLEIFERILDKRLRQQVDIGEMQFGFMPGKRTVDSIFMLRQRQGKIFEGNGTMYTAFVDLEKAHDQVPREVLYRCLGKRGVSEKLVRVVKSLYGER